MARNRKRAKERRDRRPQTVGSRSSLGGVGSTSSDGIPSPLEHAAPDAELADAQLAIGRPDLVGDSPPQPEEAQPEDGGALEDQESVEAARGPAEGGGSPPEGPPGEGAVAVPGPVPAPQAKPRARLIAFLEGSWRELQRVQWPDRRQVMQATAVVIGFVIVAGVFLAVADTAASHLMSYILTGH